MMQSRFFAPMALLTMLVIGGVAGFAQSANQTTAGASPTQRLEVLRSRLDSLRRSLNSAIAAVNAKDSNDKSKDAEDPRVRLAGLEKEVSSLSTEVNDLRGKIDRSERLESNEIDQLETSVAELNTRVEGALQATAGARSARVVGDTSSKKKKKGKFLGIFGGGSEDKYEELTGTVAPGRDRVLFEEATLQVRKGNQEIGRLLFNTIITTYPDSDYLPLAKLAIADSFYLEGTTSALIQAASTYQDWLTFFPTDPLADKVMLKMAECEMRQMGLANRDISRAQKAEQRLKVLLQQFPDTSLKNDVSARLNEVQENLGMHNLMIARFYYDRNNNEKGGLKGAQFRLKEIVEKYPNFSYLDEVYFTLGSTYVLEEEPDEAAKFFQTVVRDYPNSRFAEKAKEQLQLIGAAIPEPDPIKKQIAEPERPSMTQKLLIEISGSANVTVDKNGVLISKDSEGHDLIDEAISNRGQITSPNTPTAPVNRRAPARPLPQSTSATQPAGSTSQPQSQP